MVEPILGEGKRDIHLVELKGILFPWSIGRNAPVAIQDVVDESGSFGFG
jgi:hypothetical protein